MANLITSIFLWAACVVTACLSSGIGYRIGNATGYKLIKKYNKSALYEVECAELDDGRPIRLIQLVGSHFQVGYDYASLLGPSILQTYHTFMDAQFNSKWQQFLLQNFLDWQYDSVVSRQIPHQFKEQLRGLQAGGTHEHSIRNLRSIFERTLVISSYPGNFSSDIIYTLLDQFMREYVRDQRLLNIIQSQLFACVKFLKQFLNRKIIHCSFFALWGNRTQGSKLITMRNLDWEANTGTNKFKTVFVWKIDGTIPHVTLGFPGLMGALTGMSKAGLTVHEAGLDSMRATEVGFQWSLRLRYVMMHASNLREARKIWEETNNTLGMNHMIASASDLVTDHPAYVMETMRNYTAWFMDDDQRERGTTFVDPQTKQKFRAGFAMKQAVFRTNHAYDPKINKYRTRLPGQTTSTMRRYMVMKNAILHYENINKLISNEDAINITAATAHKGGNDPLKCPGPGDQGTNVLSVVYTPANLGMLVAFEYGSGKEYQTACCGVYVYIDMSRWLN